MRLLSAIALLALVASVAGCDPGRDGDREDPSTPPTGATGATGQPAMAQTREQVRATTEDVLDLLVSDKGALASAKPTLAGASGSWAICDDDSVTWSYNTSGRIDFGLGDNSLGFLRVVREALEGQGWVYDSKPVSADPTTSVTARKGPHLLRVQGGGTKPLLLVSVYGPCIEPTEAQRADLESHRKSEPIELP